MDKHALAPLLAPQAIVVFAGVPDAPDAQLPQGRALAAALRAQRYAGTLQFLDIHATGTFADLAQVRADLAIIALPADEVALAVDAAIRLRCRAALIVSTTIDAAAAAALRATARRDGLLLLGPNSLGFQVPHLGLNASAAGPLARDGSLGFVCQSGALTAALLDWARGNGIGFSLAVSVGRHTAIDIAEVLDYLANDPRTRGIVVYLEGIGSARRFMSALRRAAVAKPVVVLKAGRRPAGNAAAVTHSAAAVGSDEVFDAALRRAGVVRVGSFVDLFSSAKALAVRYRPVGTRLAVVTNGGGPGVLAADHAHEIGLQLATLSAEAAANVQPELPRGAGVADLIDLSEEAGPGHYVAAIRAAMGDGAVDGVLAIHSPKVDGDPVAVARAVAGLKGSTFKPLLTCWLGDASMAEARRLLNEADFATFRTPEAAVGAFGSITSFYENQRLLQQTPSPLSELAQPDLDGARLLVEAVLAERRTVLTEMESKALLAAFHVPVTQTLVARTPHEAMMIATQLGFPVALKIASPDIAHKSDVQGVALDLASGAAVREAFDELVDRVKRHAPDARIDGVAVQRMVRSPRGREISVGLVADELFGPVVVFGAGGVMIELIADRAMELPPLNQFLARRLIERARVAGTLGAWRGAGPADIEALERILLRVSEMAVALPQLRQMDINPVIVDETGAVAVDARIVVEAGTAGHAPGAYGQLAILPYPVRYEQTWALRGGGTCLVRPIRPEDANMLQALVRGMTPESRYFRFVSSFSELPAPMLARFTLIDYDREMALAAIVREHVPDAAAPEAAPQERERIVGVSRYVINPDGVSCEFSLVTAEDMKGRGLGTRLMESIMDVARDRGLTEMMGLVLSTNVVMLRLLRTLGFSAKRYAEDPEFVVVSHPL